MIIDTGPIVSILDKDDEMHLLCVSKLNILPRPLLITQPCLTEAMHLLGRSNERQLHDTLWDLRKNGFIAIHYADDSESDFMGELMHKYSDSPMDYADASIVAAARTLKDKKIFSLDSHFYFYTTENGEVFDVLPVRGEIESTRRANKR